MRFAGPVRPTVSSVGPNVSRRVDAAVLCRRAGVVAFWFAHRRAGQASIWRSTSFFCGSFLWSLSVAGPHAQHGTGHDVRSEEHTSELQSLMRISYAGF